MIFVTKEIKIGFINTILLIIFIIDNVFDIIKLNQSFQDSILNIAPLIILLIISIITFIARSMEGYAILYFIAGLFIAFFSSADSVHSIVFINLAICIFKNYLISFIFIISLFIVSFFKFLSQGFNFFDYTNVILFYFGVYCIFYIIQKDNCNGQSRN